MNHRNLTRNQNRVYGTIIFSSAGRILIVQGRETGKWSFPKGHKNNAEEQPLECALRETWEESGLLLGKGYLEMLQLAAGRYFVYRLEDEPALLSHDNNEIMDMRWVPLDSLATHNNNCDIRSYLMRGHMERHKKELALHEKMEKYQLDMLSTSMGLISV
jgi:8-oxo-dGTP pyrophosphatase MutT (NUDIX family)